MQDVAAILDQYRVRYNRQGKDIRHGWVGLSCPWCGRGGGEQYLGISLATGLASCWRCGPKRLPDILVALARIPLADAIAACGGLAYAARPARLTGHYQPPADVGPLLPAHLAYLAQRGLDPAPTAALWGLMGIGMAARLPWSIFIPIH